MSLSAVLLLGLSLRRFDFAFNRLLSSLIFVCGIGGKRITVFIDLIVVYVRRTHVFAADGVETETNLSAFGIDDDLLVFGIDGNNLADHTTNGDDLSARLQVGTEILTRGLLLLSLLGLPEHHAKHDDNDDDKKNVIQSTTPWDGRSNRTLCPEHRV